MMIIVIMIIIEMIIVIMIIIEMIIVIMIIIVMMMMTPSAKKSKIAENT